MGFRTLSSPDDIPIVLAALLHDIGKIYNYYENEAERYRTKYPEYWHAGAGAELLKELDFPYVIRHYVKYSHTPDRIEKEEYLSLIDKPDKIDARLTRKREKRERASVSIDGLSFEEVRTLHGGGLLEVLRDGLKFKDGLKFDETTLVRCVSMLKETTLPLRADLHVKDVSLYIHSLIVSAIVSCWIRGEDPLVVLVETDVGERAKFARADRVEYLSGLQFYAYLGLLGAIAKCLRAKGLIPDVHILSETPLHVVMLIPQSLTQLLKENLARLSEDLHATISLKIIDLEGEVVEEDILRPRPRPLRLGRKRCHFCMRSIPEGEEALEGDKIVCLDCKHISMSYRYIGDNSIVLLVDGVYERGLVYRNLGITAILGMPSEFKDLLIMRLLNPSDYRSIVKYGIVPVDFRVEPFNKDYKIWIIVDAGLLLERFLKAEVYKLHRLATVCSLLPILLENRAKEILKDVCSLLKLDSTSLILQTDSRDGALKFALECLKIGLSSVLVKAGSPGFTFRKLLTKAGKLRVEAGEPYVFVEYEGGVLITEKKYKEACNWVENLARLTGIPMKSLLKIAIDSLPTLEQYGKYEDIVDPVDKVLLLSELLCRLAPIVESILTEDLIFFTLDGRTALRNALFEKPLNELVEILSILKVLYTHGILPEGKNDGRYRGFLHGTQK